MCSALAGSWAPQPPHPPPPAPFTPHHHPLLESALGTRSEVLVVRSIHSSHNMVPVVMSMVSLGTPEKKNSSQASI